MKKLVLIPFLSALVAQHTSASIVTIAWGDETAVQQSHVALPGDTLSFTVSGQHPVFQLPSAGQGGVHSFNICNLDDAMPLTQPYKFVIPVDAAFGMKYFFLGYFAYEF